MTEVNRVALMGKFQNGDRPDESDFGNLIESCLNKVSDGLKVDGDMNFVLSRGLQLGDSASTVAGTLRFNSGAVQFNNGSTWLPVGGNAGVFTSLSPTTVAYNGGGLVGIGSTFSTATPPIYRFEVNLAANTALTEQVRFGSAVIANGAGAFSSAAVFSHRNHATDTNYALRQVTSGAVHLNAALNQVISIRQNNVPVLSVATGGQVVIGGGGDVIDPTSSGEILQVHGQVIKNTPGTAWANFSDERIKEDVRDLEEGLAQLRRVRPVRYRYNELAGSAAGAEGVGILAQEMEKVFPETVSRIPGAPKETRGIEDMRIFDGSMLTFVLINAVKELAAKVEQLESALAAHNGTPA
ncbi:MAG: tail fiber domain-containing protein [Chromatiaceae bacterium]|nr:tail fiber domain-containing protein [Chromatiaceae bacterium]